jgi:hypothetical protein
MRERYITPVMGTSSKSPISNNLNDAEVMGFWIRRQRSEATRSVYRRDMGRLATWSDKTLAETDPLDLERFAEMLTGSGLAPISQGRTLAAVRSFFRFAERIGFCRNVAAGLELPRSEPALSERIIPQEDVRRMIALEPDGRNRVLLAVLYAAGLRVSEACGLRWRNLQSRADAGQILIHGKGGRTRRFAAGWRVGPAPRSEGHSGAGRSSVRVTFGRTVGAFPRLPDCQGSQPAGRNCRQREHPLVTARSCIPRARSRRADSSGTGDAGTSVSGDNEPVFTCQTGGVERGISGRLAVGRRRPTPRLHSALRT